MFCQFDPKKEKKKEGAQHLYIYNFESNVTCAQYWILKLDEEKLKYAGLDQQNGFGTAFLHILLLLLQGIGKPNTC